MINPKHPKHHSILAHYFHCHNHTQPPRAPDLRVPRAFAATLVR